MLKRCNWSTSDKIYIEYHDKEWGKPVHNDQKLFEMIVLEGAQAGLSWITILKRRQGYRKAYDQFDPRKIAKWNSKKIDRLLKDEGIIRNRLKVQAAKINAEAFLKVVEEFGTFDKFIWSFVSGKPIQNCFKKISDIPAATKESEAMSEELKRRGFKFVGPTICYAFMQAVGMVNDHIVDCFRYKALKND
jgi:DNA-3-methyladenine glycosylase I